MRMGSNDMVRMLRPIGTAGFMIIFFVFLSVGVLFSPGLRLWDRVRMPKRASGRPRISSWVWKRRSRRIPALVEQSSPQYPVYC
jgi:hypothetical protein